MRFGRVNFKASKGWMLCPLIVFLVSAPGVAADQTETLWDAVTVTVPDGWRSMVRPESGQASWWPDAWDPQGAMVHVLRSTEVIRSWFSREELEKLTPAAASIAGREARLYERAGGEVKSPVKLWLLDEVLPGGDWLAIAVQGTKLAEHGPAVEGVLATLKIQLPAGSGPADRMEVKSWKGMTFAVPVTWKEETGGPGFAHSYDFLDPVSGRKASFLMGPRQEYFNLENLRNSGELSEQPATQVAGRPAQVYTWQRKTDKGDWWRERIVLPEAGAIDGQPLVMKLSVVGETWDDFQPLFDRVVGTFDAGAVVAVAVATPAFVAAVPPAAPAAATLAVGSPAPAPPTLAPVVGPGERRKPVKLEGKEVLPLRVLARPFSHVYKGKSLEGGTVRENVPVFQPFYVYTRPAAEDLELESGWYEVGTDNRGTVVGWMQSKDVFEWKQTMCLAYTHPEGRKPVLIFEGRGPLEELLRAGAEGRVKKAGEYYATIDSRNIPPGFPVKSMEPKKAVDIGEQFYLLPILDFSTMELEGREGRLLRLAAATGAGPDAREASDIRKDPGYLQQATSGSTETSSEILNRLAIDVVWVMDTTVSMRPYIAKTLEVVKQVSQEVTREPEVAEAMKFGFWGYRDSAKDIPGIEYTTYNYTPGLQGVTEFIPTVAGIKVTSIDSVDYPEDMFSGVDDALRKTGWTPEALRILVLVGDAPGHELGHRWNLSGQSETTLRELADDSSVYVFALHVKDPRAKRFHETAENQLRVLSRNKGMSGESAYWPTASDDVEGFARATAELTAALTTAVKAAKGAKPALQAVVARIQPQSVQGNGEFTNDIILMTDGVLAEEGSPWDGEKSVFWSAAETFFTIDLGSEHEIVHLLLQLDDNDAYAVDVSVDGQIYKPLLRIEPSHGEVGAGLDTMSTDPTNPEHVQELAFLPAIGRYLKVYAVEGDAAYAVSEIGVSGRSAPSKDSGTPSGGPGGELGSLEPVAQAAPGEEKGVRILAGQMIRAALVEWIGSQAEAKAPRDIVGWAVDKDLVEPAIQSMEVRLLVNKRQLDSLRTVLGEVMAAGRRGQIGGEDFFSALQATAATAARDPNQIRNARSMAATGLIPEFLQGLPYKSRLMDMSNELWASWSIDEQDRFLNELEAMMKAYQAIHDRPEGWIALNSGDDPDEHVYPVSLELLP